MQHFLAVLLEHASARALRLARRKFLAPERVDMTALADELGVNRGTLYRWVGSPGRLLGGGVWSLADRVLTWADETSTGAGGDRVVQVVTRFLDRVIVDPSMQRFLLDEGELA